VQTGVPQISSCGVTHNQLLSTENPHLASEHLLDHTIHSSKINKAELLNTAKWLRPFNESSTRKHMREIYFSFPD